MEYLLAMVGVNTWYLCMKPDCCSLGWNWDFEVVREDKSAASDSAI